jgi:Na+-transporting NADH:ubiquinone oxidoreductase subunit NqrB
MLFLGDLLGAILVSLLLVNLVRLLARARFSHWRHIATAYLVFFLMAVALEMIMGAVRDKRLPKPVYWPVTSMGTEGARGISAQKNRQGACKVRRSGP